MPETREQHWSMPNLDMTPPGYWRFHVQETGQWFTKYLAFSDLIRDLHKHYTANQFAIPPNLPQLILDQLCPELPMGWCEGDAGHQSALAMQGPLTFKMVLAGTQTLMSWQRAGRPKVAMAEATERASICARCKYNIDPSGCPSCNSALGKMVDAFVRGEKTQFNDRLRACKVCGCSLKSKIWFPLDIIRSNMPRGQQELFPDWCWLALKEPETEPDYATNS